MSVKSQRLRWLAWGVLLVGLALLLVWIGETGAALFSLQAQALRVQTLLEADPRSADPQVLGEILQTVRGDVMTLRRNVGWMTPAGRWFAGAPKVGPLLAQARDLLLLADSLTEMGVLVWEDGAPLLTAYQSGAALDAALVEALPRLAEHEADLRLATAHANRSLARLDLATLPATLREPLTQLRAGLPLVEAVLPLLPFAGDLLGLDGVPRTYLALALNEDELRPGGGFITGVGEVQMAAGRVVTLTFSDSYRADDFTLPYPEPPQPLQQFMNIYLWVFRDSNWSPDFPTAAQQALALYRPKGRVVPRISGIIAADQYAVRLLVDAVGPLTLADAAAPVTGDTLLDYIHQAWAPENGDFGGDWWANRKAFMGKLAAAAVARVQSGAVNPAVLAEAVQRLFAERHLMVYLTHAPAQAALPQRWSGALQHPSGDYLMVAEANVGYNKASSRMERALAYHVDLERATPQATLQLTYIHTSQNESACVAEARYDPAYVQMMERCYWGYWRIFVPRGAHLLDASRHPLAATQIASGVPWEGVARVMAAAEGYTGFEQMLLLPTRSQAVMTFTYTLPAAVVRTTAENEYEYRLLVQKQAGIQILPVHMTLLLPQNAVLLAAQPAPMQPTGRLLSFETDLRTDWSVRLRYRLPEEVLK